MKDIDWFEKWFNKEFNKLPPTTQFVNNQMREQIAREDRDYQITLLEEYSNWLMEHGYLDTDWKDEPPYAIDEFLKTLR